VESRFTRFLAVHETCVDLFFLGDYFGIQGLMDLALQGLKSHNEVAAAEFQRAFMDDEYKYSQVDITKPEYQMRFFAQAKIVFDNEHLGSWHKLRDTFVLFFKHTRYLTLQQTSTRRYLAEVPSMAVRVLESICRDESTDIFSESFPAKCYWCNTDILAQKDRSVTRGTYYSMNWMNNDEAVGVCNECYHKHWLI
jgi:hypothetical protein